MMRSVLLLLAWAGLAPAADIVLQSKGYAVPVRLVQVSPRVAGEIVWVDEKLFVEGALVKQGTLLAKLDPREHDLKVKKAKAAFLAARRLAKVDPKHDADEAQARLELAELRRSWCEIKAPLTGTILAKKAELGNLVNPAALSSGISSSLCEMADLAAMEIDLTIQERDITLVEPGQKCLVMPEAYSEDKRFLKLHPQGYEGTVSRIMPNADRAKGAIPVRVVITKIPADEAGRFLRPEMGALVSLMGVAKPKKEDIRKAGGPGLKIPPMTKEKP